MGAILVFDLTRPQSLVNLSKWYNEFSEVAPNKSIIIFGNKKDLTDLRMIDEEEVKKFAEEINAISYLETSAKTGDNVEEAFNLIGEAIYKKILEM